MSVPLSERAYDSGSDGYSFDPDQVRQLTSDLLADRPPDIDDKYVCYMVDGASRFADIGRYVEAVRFEQAFRNTPGEMMEQYGGYDSASIFFISVDREKSMPTGVLRVIHNSPQGLKTINDLALPPQELSEDDIKAAHGIEDFDDCWDIGTVAAMQGYPSRSASIQLYRAMYVAAMKNNIEHIVSIIDSHALKGLKDYLGVPFKPLANSEPFEYLGSENSQAVYGDVSEFYTKMHRKRHTLRGFLARKALSVLVEGTRDYTLFLDDYKN